MQLTKAERAILQKAVGKTIAKIDIPSGAYEGSDNRALNLTFTDGSDLGFDVQASARAQFSFFRDASDKPPSTVEG